MAKYTPALHIASALMMIIYSSYYLYLWETLQPQLPVTNCILPFFIARDSLMPSFGTFMLNTGFTNISNLDIRTKSW